MNADMKTDGRIIKFWKRTALCFLSAALVGGYHVSETASQKVYAEELSGEDAAAAEERLASASAAATFFPELSSMPEETEPAETSMPEETAEPETQTASYTAPEQSGVKTVNFDSSFGLIYMPADGSVEEEQGYLDSGLIVVDYGDYYHHSTAAFKNMVFSLNPGDTVMIGGCQYTFGYLDSGGYINYDWGTICDSAGGMVEDNGVTQIIFCNGNNGGRYIAVLY